MHPCCPAGNLDDSFYTDEAVKQQFQQHIYALLNRRNVYTEDPYHNTPAIFACAHHYLLFALH
jgi:hypothetical protein